MTSLASERHVTTAHISVACPTKGRKRADGSRVFRRVNRAAETDPKHVLRAIPRGSVRAVHPTQTERALELDQRFALFNANRQASIRAVLKALVMATDMSTMTARPGHAFLERHSGVLDRSLRRQLQTLRRLGLLGDVAPGRSAEHAAPGPDGERINEAAVYVLCVPADFAAAEADGGVDPDGWNASQPADPRAFLAERAEAAEPAPDRGVDNPGEKVGLPSRFNGGPLKHEMRPTHARDENGGDFSFDDGVDPSRLRRTVEFWPPGQAARTKAERVRAGEQLRVVAPVLRVLSGRDVASICRPFLKRGWTVSDVLYAIDHGPDRIHDMLPLALGEPPARVRGWLRHRLEFWRADDGTILPSKSERDAAEAEAVRRDQVQAWAELVASRAERAAIVASPGWAKGAAAARAVAAEGKKRAAELVGRGR